MSAGHSPYQPLVIYPDATLKVYLGPCINWSDQGSHNSLAAQVVSAVESSRVGC